MIDQVLNFWFEECDPQQWFIKDEAFDKKVESLFSLLHEEIAEKKHTVWRLSARGCLAEIIVLDQFSRNMFRGSANAFAFDIQARDCLNYAISMAYDKELSQIERNFLYLPFEHSEASSDQEKSIFYYSKNGDPDALDYAIKHKLIIDTFARYPHRNVALGRISTEEEELFLRTPGSKF